MTRLANYILEQMELNKIENMGLYQGALEEKHILEEMEQCK